MLLFNIILKIKFCEFGNICQTIYILLMSNKLKKKPLILIVDKEKPMQRALYMILVMEGYDPVVVVDNGRSVLEVIHAYKKKLDLILIDIDLTGLSVIDVLEDMNKNNIRIPFILMGYINRENRIDLILSGCSNFIEKPFTIENIIASVSTVLKGVSIQKTG